MITLPTKPRGPGRIQATVVRLESTTFDESGVDLRAVLLSSTGQRIDAKRVPFRDEVWRDRPGSENPKVERAYIAGAIFDDLDVDLDEETEWTGVDEQNRAALRETFRKGENARASRLARLTSQ